MIPICVKVLEPLSKSLLVKALLNEEKNTLTYVKAGNGNESKYTLRLLSGTLVQIRRHSL